MFRKSLASLIAAGLLAPAVAQAEIIDALLNVNDVLGSICGQRTVVLWVDETEQIPPCIMAYSDGCVEAQFEGPQSCEQQLQTMQIKASSPQATSTVSVN